MAKLRLGVIGAGSWTVSSHLPNLARHRDEIEFVIVNRRTPERLRRVQEAFGFARATTEYREVVAAGCDIVVVASPAASHYEHARAALKAGAHVRSGHTGAAGNRRAVKIRAIGSEGQFHLDLRENILWRYRGQDDDVRVPLGADAGLYDCIGPIEALVEAGLGRPIANNSPAELGARTVEILDASYRSAKSGRVERIATTHGDTR